jgi:hypothetical protein
VTNVSAFILTAVPAAQPKADTDDITEAAGTAQFFVPAE